MKDDITDKSDKSDAHYANFSCVVFFISSVHIFTCYSLIIHFNQLFIFSGASYLLIIKVIALSLLSLTIRKNLLIAVL